MIKHYVTCYGQNGKRYAEAWLQVNLFGKCFCFWKRRLEIGHMSNKGVYADD